MPEAKKHTVGNSIFYVDVADPYVFLRMENTIPGSFAEAVRTHQNFESPPGHRFRIFTEVSGKARHAIS